MVVHHGVDESRAQDFAWFSVTCQGAVATPLLFFLLSLTSTHPYCTLKEKHFVEIPHNRPPLLPTKTTTTATITLH